MQALHIEMDGLTTSFRLPHIHVGRQVTYRLPPPSTILGQIAAALGGWPDRRRLSFAYSFRALARLDDVEATWVTEVGGAVPTGDKLRFPHRVNVSATMNPYKRKILYGPHLDLYLQTSDGLDDLFQAFRSPRYMVLLGRSQDLAGYRRVELIESEQASEGYVEGALLPIAEGSRFPTAFPMTMPRFIDPEDRRRVDWAPYLLLEGRATIKTNNEPGPARALAHFGERFDIDPGSPQLDGLHRILVWHHFTEEGAVVGRMAGTAE